MNAATKIRIEFSESREHQNRAYDETNPKVFEGDDCWTLAQAYLNVLAHYGPKSGYDKTDVVVTFADGHEYGCRLDIQHPDGRNPDHRLAEHIRRFCRFYGGLVADKDLPSHLTPERYKEFLGFHTAEEREYFATFLEKYAVPEF